MRNFRGNDREDDHGKEAQNQENRGEEEGCSQNEARRAGPQEEAHRPPHGQKSDTSGEAGPQGQGASQGRQDNCQAGRQVNRKAKASSGEDHASATHSRDERPSADDGARPRGDADRTATVAVSLVGAG
jgi:hypothetical protein